jgi:hypothetical protein
MFFLLIVSLDKNTETCRHFRGFSHSNVIPLRTDELLSIAYSSFQLLGFTPSGDGKKTRETRPHSDGTADFQGLKIKEEN